MRILDGGRPGFLYGELVDLRRVELLAQGRAGFEEVDARREGTGALLRPPWPTLNYCCPRLFMQLCAG